MRFRTLIALSGLLLSGCGGDARPDRLLGRVFPFPESAGPETVLRMHGIDATVRDGDVLIRGRWEDLLAARTCMRTHAHADHLGLHWLGYSVVVPGTPVDLYPPAYEPKDHVQFATVEVASAETLVVVRDLEDEGVRTEIRLGYLHDLVYVHRQDLDRANAVAKARPREGLTRCRR